MFWSKKKKDNHGPLIRTNLVEVLDGVKKEGKELTKEKENLENEIQEMNVKNEIIETDLKLIQSEAMITNHLEEVRKFWTTSLSPSQPIPKIPKDFFPNSLILKDNNVWKEQLARWYGKPVQWKLLYRATRDTFNSNTGFHDRCDHQGETISLVQTNKGNVFGGYAKIPWKKSGGQIFDDDAWLFSLKNPRTKKMHFFPKIPKSVKNVRAYYHASGYSVWFGSNDLFISNNANLSNSSYSNLSQSFEYHEGGNGNDFFDGQKNFTVAEIEVFGLKK